MVESLHLFFCKANKLCGSGQFPAVFPASFLYTGGLFLFIYVYRGRILGRNWDKNLKIFPPCFHSDLFLQILHPLPPPPLLKDFTPCPPWGGLKLVCNVNIAYGNLKSENSQDYAQKPQRKCKLMNSASVHCTHQILYKSDQKKPFKEIEKIRWTQMFLKFSNVSPADENKP